jgi:hypothetical protein
MENTGYKSFAELELYFIDDNSYAGVRKPNIVTDIRDYIAPVLDTKTCAPSVRYYNTLLTKSAKRNNCSSGYSGSNATLTADANQFVSNSSVADANAQAEAWLAANVQTYANNTGICELTWTPPSGGGGGGGGGCFVEGTLIALPDGTQLPIETLVVNQLLLSAAIETLQDTNNVSELYQWNTNFLQEKRMVSPITKIEPKIAYETIIINKGLLEATPSHSQLIQRDGVWKFIPLGNVTVGDNLYGINKEIIAITSVLVSLEKRNIYPLILNPSHTYFANGILTHNNKQPFEPNP